MPKCGSCKFQRGLTEPVIRLLAKNIRQMGLDARAEHQHRTSDLHLLLGTSDTDLLVLRTKDEAFLTAAMMVLETLEKKNAQP